MDPKRWVEDRGGQRVYGDLIWEHIGALTHTL
jgi:hypothetical protein